MSHILLCPFDAAALVTEAKTVPTGPVSRYVCPNGDYATTWGLDAVGVVSSDGSARTADPERNVVQTASGGGGTVELGTASLAALESVTATVAFPATQTVAGTVSVSNFPTTQPVSVADPVPVTGTFYPATQPISGTVSVGNFPATQAVSGTVTANTGLTQPLTDTQLRATAVPVSGTVSVGNFPATQPVSGTVTANTGLTQPLTDTQLRATAVPVSLASAPTTPVTGTFWQATQPVSGPLTNTELRATAVPVSGTFWPATQPVSGTVSADVTDRAARAVGVVTLGAGTSAIGNINELRAATTFVTVTAAAAAAATLTLPAPGVGLFHYITGLDVRLYSTVARTGVATPILVTTTNLAGSPVFTFATAATIGSADLQQLPGMGTVPVRASVANTATTVVAPAVTGGIWRITASYFIGA